MERRARACRGAGAASAERLPWLQPCPCPPTRRSQEAEWFAVDRLPRLAFDHKLIVRTALRHLAATSHVQRQRPHLAGQLLAAAEKLEGPWQQQE